uniref:Vomeronasal type-1 receptor n=1 Tax=Panagrolaimus davidi TaxID=227884 RepID=A0A914P119_9BILA
MIAATSFMLHASFAYAPNPFPQFIPSLSPSGMSVEEIAETRRWHFRIIFCSLNFIATVIITAFIQRPKIVKQTNVQRFTISLTQKLLFIKVGIDISVFVIEFAVSNAAGYSAVNILGSYARAFSALDAFLSSLCFSYALKTLSRKTQLKSQTSVIAFTEQMPSISK